MNGKLQENIIVLIKKRLKEGWIVTIDSDGTITIKPKELKWKDIK